MGQQRRYTDKEIKAMHAACPIRVGDRVRVTDGDLAGLDGEVVELQPSCVHVGELRVVIRVVAPCLRSVRVTKLERED